MQRQRFRLEFEKHRGFLALEEQLQLRRLEEEERATLQRLRDSKDQLAQHSKALKELAEELEERCQRPALGLLEGVQGALSRSKAVMPLEPETIPMELKTPCRIPGMREMLRRFQGGWSPGAWELMLRVWGLLPPLLPWPVATAEQPQQSLRSLRLTV
nr:E3 ubiquitin-protein ligase TRIM58-like isoform X2 [Marmota flaviventris]